MFKRLFSTQSNKKKNQQPLQVAAEKEVALTSALSPDELGRYLQDQGVTSKEKEAAIKQLHSISACLELNSYLDGEGRLKNLLNGRLKALVSDEFKSATEEELINQARAQKDFFYQIYLLCLVRSQPTLASLVEGYSEPELIALLLEHPDIEIKQFILTLISSDASLQVLSKRVMNKNKTLYKLVKQQIRLNKEQIQKESERVEVLERFTSKLKAFMFHSVSSQLPLEHMALMKKWEVISKTASETEADIIKPLLAEANAYLASHQQAIDDMMTESQAVSEQNAVVELLDSALSQIVKHESNLDSFIQSLDVESLRRRWDKTVKYAPPESGLSFRFESANKKLERLRLALIRLASEKDSIQSLLEEINEAQEPEALRKALNDKVSLIQWPKPDFALPNLLVLTEEKIGYLSQQIASKHEAEKKLIREVIKLKRIIESQLQKGTLKPADRLLEKLKEKYQQLPGKEQARLEKSLLRLTDAIENLKDWKGYVTSPKKRYLVEQMRALVEWQGDLLDKAEQIKYLQEQWKDLSFGDKDSDDSASEFRQLADKAFEPCAKYFNQKKQERERNLTSKIEMCDELEAFCESVDTSKISWEKIGEIKKQAKSDWRKYSPVEHAKVKESNKRFNQVLDKLDGLIDKIVDDIVIDKKQLIQKAEKLQQEDISLAIDQAKGLQGAWKEVSTIPYKKERELWTEFRKHIDRVFERRNKALEEQSQQEREDEDKAQSIIDELTTISKSGRVLMSTAEIETCKSRFNKLDGFSKKRNGKIRDSFKEVLRLIEQSAQMEQRRASEEQMIELERKVTLCREIESQLILCIDNATEQWPSLFDGCPDGWESDVKLPSELETIASYRLTELAKLVQSQDREVLVQWEQENTHTKLDLCLESEIASGAQSPDMFKSVRMERQIGRMSEKMMTDKQHTDTTMSLRQLRLQWHKAGLSSREVELRDRFEKAMAFGKTTTSG